MEVLLRSLSSLPSIAPYARESRPRFRRFGDVPMYPAMYEGAVPMEHAYPLEVHGASGSRSGRKGSLANATSSRAHERELHDAARSKKRKAPPASPLGKGRSVPDASAAHVQRAPLAAQGAKRRADPAFRGRPGWNDEQGDESEEGSDGYDARQARGSRVRGRHPAEDAPDAWARRSMGTAYGVPESDSRKMPTTAARGAQRNRTANASAGSGREDGDDQRYCFCNNVSYGDMIGCDDDHCEREWFHLGCVGLSKPPQGTWYCDACLERRAQQARTKAKRSARPARAPEAPAAARRVVAGRR